MLTKREEHGPASMCTGGRRHSPRACEAAQQHQPHRASHPWNSPSPVPRGCQDDTGGKEKTSLRDISCTKDFSVVL